MLNNPNGAVAYRFHTRDLHLAMGAATPGTFVGFGQPPGALHGIDVDQQSAAAVTARRPYQPIRQPKPIADRRVEIEFVGSGVEVFAFTFG